MAKQTAPDFSRIVSSADYPSGQSEFIIQKFIQYKVGGALALLMEVDGILIEFPVYGQAYRTIQHNFTIEVVKEESTYNVINLVKK